MKNILREGNLDIRERLINYFETFIAFLALVIKALGKVMMTMGTICLNINCKIEQKVHKFKECIRLERETLAKTKNKNAQECA